MIAYLALLRRFWWALPIAGLLVALALTRITLADVKGERDKAVQAAKDEKAAHRQTEANYRAAAVEAEKRALANVVRVKGEQEKITHDELEKANARALDRDARYQRLLAQAKAYSSGAGATDVPEARDTTCRAYAGTACEELPALLNAAQENTDNLIRLQSWVDRQAVILTTPLE